MNKELPIPILVPEVPAFGSIKKYFEAIDVSKIYSNFGPLNSKLRERISIYTGVPSNRIATCANATLAIQGLIQTDLELSYKWVMPVWTFTATAAAALNSGAAISFVDSRDNWRGDFGNGETFDYSILDVAPFGDSLDLTSINSCRSLIVDAAPSFDALQDVRLHNRYPIAIVVSMHATKLLPAGEGSFIISNSAEWIERFQSWTNFGMNSDRESIFVGTNAKMSEYSSAVALASLDHWDNFKKTIMTAATSAKSISHKFGLKTSPAMERGLATPYWILVMNNPNQKLLLIEKCDDLGISWRDWWKQGIHKMPAYQDKVFGQFPKTDYIAQTTIGLPMHTSLTTNDFNRIEYAISQVT
jgi:dTDP-4-amino-4,6-dideoxygalactose transaminase